MSSNTNTNILNPKPCNYNCGTRIYWNTSENAYFEVFAKSKHICPNRSSSNKKAAGAPATTINKPNYYNKKSWNNNREPKPKMSNSLELLSGPISEIQKKYEILSDIVTEYNGKVHGSQSHISANIISLVVYFEVPEGKRNEVKKRFNSYFVYTQQNYR